MSRATVARLAFAILAVAFFTAPFAARVLGITAEAFENRKLADAPKVAQGWDAFQQTSRYLVDRMPLRAQAVRANTTIWQDVFDATPRYGSRSPTASDQALPFAGIRDLDRDKAWRKSGDRDLYGVATATTGAKGWLFVGDDISGWCSRPVETTPLAGWRRLIQAARLGGRQAAMFVVPHKASIYPEYLPDTPDKECALRKKDKWWAQLAKRGPASGVTELRSELLQLKPRAGNDLFEVTDMHWTPLGAMVLIGAALDQMGNGIQVEAKEVVRRGPVPYTGDLSNATGRGKTSMHFVYDIVRAPNAPRVPGRTVVICDSFAANFAEHFQPYFEEIEFVPSLSPPAKIASEIRTADRVIIETVETNFYTSSYEAEATARRLAAKPD